MPSVVTSILVDENDKILILKRSDKVLTYKGLWSGVAGYVEEGEEPLETALKEIREEVNLKENDVELIRRANTVEFPDIYEDGKYNWKIYPFLFKTREKSKIKIDWEHTEYRWISPRDIDSFDTVPHFSEVVSKLLI